MKKRSEVFIILLVLLIVLFSILLVLEKKETNELKDASVSDVGFKIDFDSEVWEESVENNIYTIKDKTGISISFITVGLSEELKSKSLVEIGKERANEFKTDTTLEVNESQTKINGIDFYVSHVKPIQVEGLTSIYSDTVVVYSTLANGNYFSIAFTFPEGVDLSEANKILLSIKN